MGCRTCIRRLAENGYTPQRKLSKYDPRPAQASRRVRFARAHAERDASNWKDHLQGVGDIKAVTFAIIARASSSPSRRSRFRSSRTTPMTCARSSTGHFVLLFWRTLLSARVRASWTYMSKVERTKREFQRPRRWFPKKDWKRVRKQKVRSASARGTTR